LCGSENKQRLFHYTVLTGWVLQERSHNCEKQLQASSCLSVRPHEKLGSHWKEFHEIWYLSIFRIPVEKIQVWLKSDKNNGYFTWRPIYIYGNSSHNEKYFAQKSVEKIKTHIGSSIPPLPQNVPWDNTKTYGTTRHATGKSKCGAFALHAGWLRLHAHAHTHKHTQTHTQTHTQHTHTNTNTHTQYLILIAFAWQQWLWERASILRLYIHLAALYNPDAECLLRGTNWIILHTVLEWTSGGQVLESVCGFPCQLHAVVSSDITYKFRSDAMFATLQTHKTVPRSIIQGD